MTTEGNQYDQNRGQGGYGPTGGGEGVSGSSYGQTGYGREGGYSQDYGQGGGYGGAPGPGYGGAPVKPRNGMGTTALVLGIIGLLFSWTAVLGIILGIVAIILGAKGSGRAKRGEATNRGVAIGGLVTGVIGLLIGLAFAVIFAVGGVFFVNNGGADFINCIQQQSSSGADQATAQQACQGQLQRLQDGANQ